MKKEEKTKMSSEKQKNRVWESLLRMHGSNWHKTVWNFLWTDPVRVKYFFLHFLTISHNVSSLSLSLFLSLGFVIWKQEHFTFSLSHSVIETFFSLSLCFCCYNSHSRTILNCSQFSKRSERHNDRKKLNSFLSSLSLSLSLSSLFLQWSKFFLSFFYLLSTSEFKHIQWDVKTNEILSKSMGVNLVKRGRERERERERKWERNILWKVLNVKECLGRACFGLIELSFPLSTVQTIILILKQRTNQNKTE